MSVIRETKDAIAGGIANVDISVGTGDDRPAARDLNPARLPGQSMYGAIRKGGGVKLNTLPESASST